MGLLDDAIREHLDLKRQRGADPGEIERLERDALGPVRREPTARSMDAVPHLNVHADTEDDLEPATELFQKVAPAPAPKRGFLRRNRSASAPESPSSAFADHLDAGMNRTPDLTQHDPFAHDDEFDDNDPFAPDAHVGDADPFGSEDPATHEHAEAVSGPEVEPQMPPAAAEPRAEPNAAVEPEPPHLIFGTPPPPRPSFAPIPATVAEPEPEPAPDPAPADAVESEPELEPHPTEIVEPEPAASSASDLDDRARADAARETREWSVEEAFAAEDAGDPPAAADPVEEDVLEETPEFLQDTPDHDRLWFEQRPPRDFDFDG